MAKCNNCFHDQVCDFACKRCDGANCIFFVDSSRMVELPCKVGDTVYVLTEKGFPQKRTVTEIHWNRHGDITFTIRNIKTHESEIRLFWEFNMDKPDIFTDYQKALDAQRSANG